MAKTNLKDQLINKEPPRFKDKVALILSGGGARGSYQIGCWKALKDHGVDIRGVYGTSVGSINAAAIAMGDLDLAVKTWKRMDYSSVMKITPEVETILEMVKSKAGIRQIFRGLKALFDGKGIDITPLRDHLYSMIDEEAVRESGLDVGLVTYSLSELKPVMLYLEDIPEGKLVDYVLASSNYPVFKREEFDQRKFIDGGIYINIPVDMAKNKGFQDMIIIDIGSRSVIDRWKMIVLSFEKNRTLYIRPRVHFGGPMQFDSQIARKYLVEGYLDTLYNLGILRGDYTYIYETADVLRNLFEELDEVSFSLALNLLGLQRDQTESSLYFYFRQLLPVLEDHFEVEGSLDAFCALADHVLELLEVERFRIYTGKEFFQLISDPEFLSEEKFEGATLNDIVLQDLVAFLSFLSDKSGYTVETPVDYTKYKADLDYFSETLEEDSDPNLDEKQKPTPKLERLALSRENMPVDADFQRSS